MSIQRMPDNYRKYPQTYRQSKVPAFISDEPKKENAPGPGDTPPRVPEKREEIDLPPRTPTGDPLRPS